MWRRSWARVAANHAPNDKLSNGIAGERTFTFFKSTPFALPIASANRWWNWPNSTATRSPMLLADGT